MILSSNNYGQLKVDATQFYEQNKSIFKDLNYLTNVNCINDIICTAIRENRLNETLNRFRTGVTNCHCHQWKF